MAIYSLNGISLPSCYDVNGTSANVAYDINGNVVWPDTIKICTYNVGDWGWGSGLVTPEYKTDYLNLQNTIFSNINADICAMQEWSANFCTDETKSNIITNNYFTYINGQGYWAIGSKIPFISFNTLDYVQIDMSGGSGDYKKYNKAYLSINGKNVCIFNCHFATHQATQEAQAAEILSLALQEQYCIVCGDFNTVIASLTDTDYITMIKPFIDNGFADANCGAFGIFPTYYDSSTPDTNYKPATDHILVSSNITIENAYVDTTKLTDNLPQKIDHIPLVATIHIN